MFEKFVFIYWARTENRSSSWRFHQNDEYFRKKNHGEKNFSENCWSGAYGLIFRSGHNGIKWSLDSSEQLNTFKNPLRWPSILPIFDLDHPTSKKVTEKVSIIWMYHYQLLSCRGILAGQNFFFCFDFSFSASLLLQWLVSQWPLHQIL